MLFTKKTNADAPTFSDALAAIAKELGTTTPGTDEYQRLIDQAKAIQDLVGKNPPFSFKPSADTILTAAVTIFVTTVTIKHEAFNTITSKAWGLMPKLMK